MQLPDLSDFFHERGIWFWPFGFGALIFGLMLLFIGSLSPPVRRWMVPSLAVYLIGAGNITFIKELRHRRYRADLRKEREVPADKRLRPSLTNLDTGEVLFFLSLHAAWFLAFIAYNVCRGVF